MIRYDRIRGHRKAFKPCRGIHRHQIAKKRVREGFQDIRDDDGVADGNTQGTCERQPREQTSRFSGLFTARRPSVLISAQGTGSRAAPDREFRRKSDIAEYDNKE